MPPVNNGKPGTITPDEFEALKDMSGQYNAMLLAKKVAKICSKFSEPFKHEYPNSAIAAAWLTVSNKIGGVANATKGTVSTEAFEFLGSLVNTYGPEVVIQKLSKIAAKGGNTAAATSLKGLFPVAKKAAATNGARRAA